MNLLLHLCHRKSSHDCHSRSTKTLSQHGQLITTNSLLTSLPDEIIDNIINDVKHIISLIISGMNYYREVYQYIQCNELFYMFF